MRQHFSPRRHTETAHIVLVTDHCQACWDCIAVCPHRVLGKIDLFFHRHARIDRAEKCKGCLRCVEICPHQAILTREKKHDHPVQ
jgi:Pyruvate/2-oxoacid:ferredoxin oxidoreductase delta subunit